MKMPRKKLQKLIKKFMLEMSQFGNFIKLLENGVLSTSKKFTRGLIVSLRAYILKLRFINLVKKMLKTVLKKAFLRKAMARLFSQVKKMDSMIVCLSQVKAILRMKVKKWVLENCNSKNTTQ